MQQAANKLAGAGLKSELDVKAVYFKVPERDFGPFQTMKVGCICNNHSYSIIYDG